MVYFAISNHQGVPVTAPTIEEPCNPSPCEINSQCQVSGGVAVCTCLPGFIGISADCRPECVSNAECSGSQSCVNRRCRDPCAGVCGNTAQCDVVNHIPICNCPPGYRGDPYTGCEIIPSKRSFFAYLLTAVLTK